MIRVMVLIAVACLFTVAQVNNEKLFSVRGQIVDGGTGRPVSGADLELATPESGSLWENRSPPIRRADSSFAD
jgi:hypothetical protein